MSLPKVFQPFVEGAPSAVISRLALEYLVDGEALGMLFADHATAQYEREVTLTNLVNIMLDVACGTAVPPVLPSPLYVSSNHPFQHCIGG